MSDALDMAGADRCGMAEAAVAALAAGCDLLCLGTESTNAQLAEIERAVSSAVAGGTLSPDRVEESMGRVRRLAEDLQVARAAGAAPRFRTRLAHP